MSERIKLDASVPEELDSERLDQIAAKLFHDYSRSRLQGWIKKGDLLVDGEQLRPRDKVRAGALLAIDTEPEQAVGWQAQDIGLDILYEDADILVLNKPAGLVVHPGAGHADGTLVNALLAHEPNLSQLPRGGIVHRLDMETSGIMVVAKTLAAHHHLVNQLQERTVKREYIAVCIGVMTGGATIDAPMGRHPKQRKKMAVLAAGGRVAINNPEQTKPDEVKMTIPMKEIIGDYQAFFSLQHARLNNLHVDISGCEISHLAYRTKTYREYLRVREEIE